MSDIPDLMGIITLYGKTEERFLISRNIDTSARGASVRCYSAINSNKETGVLKEFCPDDSPSLMRNSKGYLVHKQGMEAEKKLFCHKMQNYIKTYQNIINLTNSDNDLISFFPQYQLFYSSPYEDDKDRIVYIWTKGPPNYTFEAFCNEIRDTEHNTTEEDILKIVLAVQSLTKRICVLHEKEYIHRDIKPSNFGFVKLGDDFLDQNIYLFDIDTICSIRESASLPAVGSNGFIEPEAEYEPANNLTDIYSIGATLFSALVLTQETKSSNYCYDNAFYDELNSLVYRSGIFIPVKEKVPEQFYNCILRILKKSLCPRRKRYQCCEDLYDDITKAVRIIRQVVDEKQSREFNEINYEQEIRNKKELLKEYLSNAEIRRIDMLLEAEAEGDIEEISANKENRFILGLAFYYGYKTKKDLKKAFHYFNNYSGANIASAVFLCSSSSEAENERSEFRCSSEILFHAAELYSKPNASDEELSEAKQLLIKAADEGSYHAMEIAVMLYLSRAAFEGSADSGIEMSQTEIDLSQAKVLGYLLKLNEKDSVIAKRIYAEMYAKGFYFGQDNDKAISLFRQLISENDRESYKYLYYCYLQQDDFNNASSCLVDYISCFEKFRYVPSSPDEKYGIFYDRCRYLKEESIKSLENHIEMFWLNTDKPLSELQSGKGLSIIEMKKMALKLKNIEVLKSFAEIKENFKKTTALTDMLFPKQNFNFNLEPLIAETDEQINMIRQKIINSNDDYDESDYLFLSLGL